MFSFPFGVMHQMALERRIDFARAKIYVHHRSIGITSTRLLYNLCRSLLARFMIISRALKTSKSSAVQGKSPLS